ncbi:hypothetical protein MTBSS4_210009 [Magnetospirillum sp. SS-4]|nr:hypothetical protein MTBSS4_210009 [Magnetospirillum sp. SS-4]
MAAVNSSQRIRAGEKRKMPKFGPHRVTKVNSYWPQTAQNLGPSPKVLCVRESILWK